MLINGYWLNQINSPSITNWQGNAVELVCLQHVSAIKASLGIASVLTDISVWWQPGAQIDLVIDRKDQIINLVEIKFSREKYKINKSYADVLNKKLIAFQTATQTKKSLWTTMITTFGIEDNMYRDQIQISLTLDDLFAP